MELRIMEYYLAVVREGNIMKVIVISIRDDEAVYREAERRIEGLMK